ncbi:MAG: phosphatase PAP2 family protein [Terracidiphilus sp.]
MKRGRLPKASGQSIVERRFLRSFVLILLFGHLANAQSFSNPPQPSEANPNVLPDAPSPKSASPIPSDPNEKDVVTLRATPYNVLKDQAAIWTSPARIREQNLAFLVPLVLATTVAITADHQIMSSDKLDDASLNSHASTASNGLLGGFVAAPVIIYGLGHIHHDDHATETGILAGEAMVDSLVVDEVLKAVTMRERPTLDSAKGKFFQTSVGLDSSFPSTHSMIAWSSAAVIASEYKGPITKLTAYGLATGLSVSRVLARQHFPSDVLVGSAVGWLVGRYVFHKHHKED